jgi:hypothetical protein
MWQCNCHQDGAHSVDRRIVHLRFHALQKRGQVFLCNYKVSTSLRAQLEPLRQAADVLVMNKASLVEEVVRKDVCPSLNTKQLSLLLSTYQTDE